MSLFRPPRTRGVGIALLPLALLAAVSLPPMARAEPANLDQPQPRHYDIPAGPLGASLTRFAADAGIALSFDTALVEGAVSPGLSGRHRARDAAERLLAGSGLEMVPRADGSYTLRQRPADSQTLDTVSVDGAWMTNGASEGTGLYAAPANRSATRLDLSQRETPQSVTVITRQRMDDQGLTQLTDVIRQTPGLTIAQSGNAGSDSSPFYSRGFAVENYLIDGIPQINSNYSSIFQSSDMALYDRVEVVRGANGLMNGIGAPGASINLIRKRPTYQPQAAVKIEGGSWDYYRGEVDVSGPLNQSGSVRGRLVGAYQDNDAYIDRLHERKKVLYAIIEADLTLATRATLGFSLQQHDASGHARGGLPAYYADGGRTDWSRSDSAAADWAYSERRFQTVFASLEHWFDNDWRLKGTLSQSNNEFDEVLGYASGGNPDRATGAGVQLWAGRWAAKPEQKSLDLYATGPFQWFGRQHDMVVGATASRTRYSDYTYPLWRFTGWSPVIDDIFTWNGATPAKPSLPPTGEYAANERVTSAYTTIKLKPLDDVAVLVGARVTDWRNDKTTLTYATSTSPESLDEDNRSETGELTPYVGVIYDLNRNWSAYLSYTSIFKPQSRKDVAGNYLDPLLGNSYETGLKGEFMQGRLNVGAALYRIQQDNLGVILPGEFAPDGSQAYRAESGTETRGFELQLNGLLTEHWQASLGFARNLVEDSDGHGLNTNVPRNTLKLFSSYRFPGVGHGLTVGGGARWQSDIYSDNQGPNGVRFTQGDYVVVDLMARYAISRRLATTVNLYNALDKEYYASTGNAYYGEPRNVRVGLELQF